MKCRACSAEVTMAVNVKTGKTVPLVPYDPAYPKAVRYSINTETRGFDDHKCDRDDEGYWMSHFANCVDPNRFNRSRKGEGND